MLSVLFWVLVGVLVGWVIPCPAWVKNYLDKAVATVKGWFN